MTEGEHAGRAANLGMLAIEPYRSADLPTIEQFIAALHDAERKLDPRLSPGVELAANALEQMLSDACDANGSILMARVDGMAVGFGCVLIDGYRDPSYVEAVRPRAYVSYLYVADDWRRRGIGRRLLDAMEAEARRGGCARLVTRYKGVNAAAARCYEAAGFTPDQQIASKPVGN